MARSPCSSSATRPGSWRRVSARSASEAARSRRNADPGGRALLQVGGERRVPPAQIVLAERRQPVVRQDGVRWAPGAGAELGRGDRGEIGCQAAQAEDLPGEVEEARLAGV